MNQMLQFASGADVLASIGKKLGPGEWLCMDQERINAFAKATSDFQWIHVDAERLPRALLVQQSLTAFSLYRWLRHCLAPCCALNISR